jgi:hypothetical protein
MPIEVIGLDKITKEFNSFQFAGKGAIKIPYLIGNEAVNLLRLIHLEIQVNWPHHGEFRSGESDYVSVGVQMIKLIN